jgi:hypothetical protein
MFLAYVANKEMANKKMIQVDLGIDRNQANRVITHFWNRRVIDRVYIDGVAYWKLNP